MLRRGSFFLHLGAVSSWLQPLCRRAGLETLGPALQQDRPRAPTRDWSTERPEKPLGALFSPEQQAAVLQALNTASEEELAAIGELQGTLPADIVEYRLQHGPFGDLPSLLNVPILQLQTLVNVCNFILDSSEEVERREGKMQGAKLSTRFFKPKIKNAEALSSIVSIVFGPCKIAWAHVDRGLAVHSWEQKEYRFIKGTYQPAVYLENISSVVSKLPKADVYVLEKKRLSNQNTNLFPVILHLRTIEAMLYALLHKTLKLDVQDQILGMSRTVVGKHFGLMVGDFRSSGMELVKQLLLEYVTQEQPRISFPLNKVVTYRNLLSSVTQNREEEMCDSLLQALAFYELLILNNTT
ncbi:PREDICTED: transcription elongation factor, mitochondrial [Crocodylus porosus]|uniref:transcription elongation factor, mitochondrial n=1 Tax=Crocodylus porosus TaxID=8502 RepID=UPI00093EE1FB|nr:PREDICTED: transcription elongation factor, mitochondrial [Crocodylus porosus]